MTSFRDIHHSATKEGVRLAVPAAVSDSSHVLLCVGVPTETVGNKHKNFSDGSVRMYCSMFMSWNSSSLTML